MQSLSTCLAVFLLIYARNSNADSVEIPVYTCVKEDDWCTFQNLTITRPRTEFKLTTENIENVTKIRFKDSSIHTWTSHVCEAFPNLNNLEVDLVYLRDIAPGALDNCTNLEVVSFWTNQLTRFDRDNFRYNYKLREINVQSNKIFYIHPETFNHLTNLEVLSINENSLKIFPLDKISRLEKLRTLYLDTNNLEDLDEDLMIEKFPALTTVYMDDNNFECDRLREILSAFAKKNISAKVWSAQHKKIRKIKPIVISGIECYDDAKMRQLMKDEDYKFDDMQFLISVTFEMINELDRKGTSEFPSPNTNNGIDRKIISGFERSLAELKRKTTQLSEANDRAATKLTICTTLFFLSVIFSSVCAFVIGREYLNRKRVTSSHSMLILSNDQDLH